MLEISKCVSVLLVMLGLSSGSWWQSAETSKDKTEMALLSGRGKPVTEQVVSSGAKRLNLKTSTPPKPGEKITFQLKFASPGKRGSSCLIYSGGKKRRLSIATNPGRELVRLGMINDEGKNIVRTNRRWAPQNGCYFFNGVTKRNFRWSDDLLGWSEYFQAMAAPLNERWFEISFIVRKDSCQTFLDGIFLEEWQPNPDFYTKPFRLTLSPGMELKQPEVTQLSPLNPLYRPVDISKRLNASGIAGKKLAAGALPKPDGAVDVDGIPFIFPAPDAAGNDNLDIGASWFRGGNLAGMEQSDRGSFGGRWAGAFVRNPTRLQFRVPNGGYNAVYLIAASDAKANTIPKLTVQFYRPTSGFPQQYAAPEIPLYTAKASDLKLLPVSFKDGSKGNLYLVKVPVDPAALQKFGDLPYVELELTKQVKPYRAYPDPMYYSTHAAGLPSAVRVFAMTLGLPPVQVEFTPDQYANIWTKPEVASYTVKLRNRTAKAQNVKLNLEVAGLDDKSRQAFSKEVALPPNAERKATFKFTPKRFGWSQVLLNWNDNGKKYTWKRSLAYLRERDYLPKKFNDPGFIFGFWDTRGGHLTPKQPEGFEIAGRVGFKTLTHGIYSRHTTPESLAVARKYNFRDYMLYGSVPRIFGFYRPKKFLGCEYDPSKPEKMKAALKKFLRTREQKPSELVEPKLVTILAEPGGIGTHGSLPFTYNEPSRKRNPKQEKKYQTYKQKLKISLNAVKEEHPDAILLSPHGDTSFILPFLQENGEICKLVDGCGVDIGYFERLPEQQFHQCSLHRLWQFRQVWDKCKNKPPTLVALEGPCIAKAHPNKMSLTPKQAASHRMRAAMIIGAYGVTRQFSTNAPAAAASYWGEQHYNGGLVSNYNGLNPTLTCGSTATLTRHLTPAEFIGWMPTGSLSTYCLKYKNVKTGKPFYALWTLRGTRPVTMSVNPDSKVTVYDFMDNAETPANKDGKVTFTTRPEPVFVYGAGNDPKLALGKPDNSDSQLGENNVLLGNAGKIAWKQVQENDKYYVGAFPDCIRRFPAEMKLATVKVPAEYGGEALSITLPPQPKDRGVMPFFTTLYPPEPLVIPGKAQYLSLWGKAASDWGRVVYSLRDAKGEQWISVGSKGQWNCDDTHGWSKFCFDGWRLLKFELPAHSSYDNYREPGTVWWGSNGGDGIVDLPLKLEKIMIERRPKAMYVNSLEKTNPAPVLLGNIYAEYAAQTDMTDAIIAISRVKMPEPPPIKAEKRINPIAELAKTGTLPAGEIISITHPETMNDGTRGVVDFKKMPGAKGYDIWLSRYPDGQGALKLGNNLNKPGKQVRGFCPDTDFYAFLVYRDEKGRTSKPSPGYKFRLKDEFAMK